MKFEIDQEKAEILKSCMAKHAAENKTLNVALKRHADMMQDLTVISDEIWQIFEKDFDLDMSLDWAFTEIDGVPCIISQKAQPPATND